LYIWVCAIGTTPINNALRDTAHSQNVVGHLKKEKMKRTLILLFVTICFTAYTQNTEKTNQEFSKHSEVAIESNLQDVAISFIDSYVKNCNKMKEALSCVDWANSNELSTKNFKAELNRIVSEANKKDPEYGLGFDPIFDEQDYPDSFEVDSIDLSSNYIVVKGKNWTDFKLAMILIKENNIWLVEGCGIINVPKEKRIKR
jgi:hypothetical protein